MAVRRETPVDSPGGRQARSEEVWVWLQRDRERRLEPAGFELLYESQGLARRLDAQLTAVSDVSPDAEEADLLRRWGVRRVRTLGTELPPHPLCTKGDSPLRPLLDAVRSQGVTIRAALLPATTFGKVAAPLFAAELDASFVPGVTSVTSDGRHYVLARPVYGEQYEALVSLELARPLVATVLPGAVGEGVRPPAAAAPRGGLQVAEPPENLAAPEAAPRLLPPDAERLDIGDAERIVAFGRGAFSNEAVALVERLAKALGATVAGTRPAADEGWLPFARQVGLTGAIVRPRLYVAVGISGAPYHMVGVKDPETLIAVNNDPEAPIFAHAHLGVVGDLFTVLPALLQRLERGEGIAIPRGLTVSRGA